MCEEVSMAHTPIVVNLDEAVQTRLAALARERQQAVSDVAAEVISTYLSPASREYKHIEAGLAELSAGKGVPNEQVGKWLDSWGNENELPPPQ
jgi:predicted transcriptional regulator